MDRGNPNAIKFSEYMLSIPKFMPYNGEGKAQIVLAGKSNVGKSSLINTVCGRRKLARISSRPGMTRMINIYNINNAVHLADLPGYGYARLSKEEKATFGPMIESFLENSPYIKQVFLVVDIRHEPSENDIQMAHYLHTRQMPFTVIATKADKIGRDRMPFIMPICRALAVQPWEVKTFSALTGFNRDEIADQILSYEILEDEN